MWSNLGLESVLKSGDVIQLSTIGHKIVVKELANSMASDIRLKKGNLIFVNDNIALGINDDNIEAVDVKDYSDLWSIEQIDTDPTEMEFVRNPIDTKAASGAWPFNCEKIIPCGNLPMQTCGCEQFEDATDPEKMGIVYYMNTDSDLTNKLDFKSCEELKYHGVYISGYFMIDGVKTYCNSWGKNNGDQQ